MRFLHTADLHLGKTYRGSPDAGERGADFFTALAGLVATAVAERVDALLIAGDLFHVGQVLPTTFSRTCAVLEPLRAAGIPCVAVEGNHDWIHRRDSLSWMEALAQMGYLTLLRPARSEEGGYRFEPCDPASGIGGRLEIGGVNLYGLGYIGAQAGSHMERVCRAVTTENNLLLCHLGVWSYSPVEIGNLKPEEAHCLAEVFGYVALGHGHKPYVVADPGGRRYAWNPGSPERVNFGEEGYAKGYYLVTAANGAFSAEFRATAPRPMHVLTLDLDGADSAEEALRRCAEQVAAALPAGDDSRRPLLEVRLTGRVAFHPFELGRERLRLLLGELADPLHVEVKNHLSLVGAGAAAEGVQKGLAEIEQEVLRELIGTGSAWRGREEELVRLALALRDTARQGESDGEELLALLDGEW